MAESRRNGEGSLFLFLGRPSSRIMSSSSGVLKEGTACAYRPRDERTAPPSLSPREQRSYSAERDTICLRSDFYRRRFESSVFGQHSMLPPREVSDRFKSKEEPSNYPSGQDTSFQNLTPMPFRFTDNALVLQTPKKVELPYYQTTTSEVGKMPVGSVDLPMRWYGRSGMFTSSWVAPPKTKVSTGLNTAMFHSDIHPTCDHRRFAPATPSFAHDPLVATAPARGTDYSRVLHRYRSVALQARSRLERSLGTDRLQRCELEGVHIRRQGTSHDHTCLDFLPSRVLRFGARMRT
mgnify:CR=1 FL=1